MSKNVRGGSADAGDAVAAASMATLALARVQHEGRPYRLLYALDPRRCAILLIGGDKTGNDRWYVIHVPIADKLYDVHLETLKKEGSIDG
jgi:hypothetical protein